MARIYAPNQAYDGLIGPVQFERGVGETNDARLISWFREHGYTVKQDPEPAEPCAKPPQRKKKGE